MKSKIDKEGFLKILKGFLKIFNFNVDKKQREKEIQVLDDRIKKAKKDLNLLLEQQEKLKEIVKKGKEKIYNDILQEKIKSNEIIYMSGVLIEPKKKVESFLNRVIKIFQGEKKTFQKVMIFYFGYKEIKIIEASIDYMNSINLDKKGIYFLKPSGKGEQFLFNNRPVVFINKDVIISPEISEMVKEKGFLSDITPEWFFSYINNVIRYRLTLEDKTADTGAFGLIKKYWFIVLIVLIIAAYMEFKKGGAPLIIPFINLKVFRSWLKRKR